MLTTYDVIIVGAGIFGITAAVELRQRQYKVAILDPGPIPAPLAASTDISKVVRMEYGADETYMSMVEESIAGWTQWNDAFGEKLYHNTGVTMLTRKPIEPGEFEYESYQLLRKRNHLPERLTADDIARRFPAWKPGAFVDGYFHAKGGYVESGRVVEVLLQHAQALGVTVYAGQTVQHVVLENGRIQGVQTVDGRIFKADNVLIAAGAWTPIILPELEPVMRATGHPVYHLKIGNSTLFKPPHFVVFTADITSSGWYGFPLHPKHDVIKIANHGVGQLLHPVHDKRVVSDADIRQLRRFLEETFPALKDATISYARRCLYCDTLDEHFWIDRHPEIEGLTVAAGGSGHGFKFAPILGKLIADALTGQANVWLPKFRWRDLGNETQGEEATRHHNK
ncbi:MAG: FAD-dependent oxidoreductase [Anaerolineales bacterium]|nr:FAD-dependent oxidoreductase [Anaerolineales bacterium]